MEQAQQTSKMAITALVLSGLFCLPFAPIVGFILGIVALVKINKSAGQLGGQTIAIIAIALGLFSSVANIGVVAAIAIPNFIRYQLRAKTSEAKINLVAIRTAQESFKSTHNGYASILPTPPEGGRGVAKVNWSAMACPEQCSESNLGACGSFECIGFSPPGQVYNRYACNASGSGADSNFTCAAQSDLDGDGQPKIFVIGTGNGSPNGKIVAPIPKLGDLGNCEDGMVDAGQFVDCTPYNF